MPTGMGLMFLAAALYCAVRRPNLLFGLLLFSAIFPATSAVTVGPLWIMPYYVVATIFVASQFFRRDPESNHAHFTGQTLLLVLGFFGATSALFFPLLFAGVPVYSPRLGSSDEVFRTFPLRISVGNVAQAAYLILNVLVVFAAASARKTATIWSALNVTFYVLVGTIGAELLCVITGIPFPYQLIVNNPDRDSLTYGVLDITSRLQGTCGEPSFTGLVLVSFFAAYFYTYYTGRGSGWKVLSAVVPILLIRSGSAFIALVAVAAAIIILNLPFRFPAFVLVRRASKLIPILLAVTLCLLSPLFLALLQEWVLDKPTSGSYAHRTTMDQYSMYLLTRTYGLGVGIGSYRASSLIATALGEVGVMGTGLAALFLLQIALRVPSQKAWVRWALVAGLIDMSLAIPDVNQPILWSLIALSVFSGTPAKTTVLHYAAIAETLST